MREPKYKVGDVLRVAEPERFVDRNKFRDRDVIVLENLLDYAYVLGNTQNIADFVFGLSHFSFSGE
ncbi:MAG: hypothetical protein EOP14_00005 [Pseudomonas sp.]|nr:MAG: hypothetical protein EOP14_00005 [Pseudomonas sp.]